MLVDLAFLPVEIVFAVGTLCYGAVQGGNILAVCWEVKCERAKMCYSEMHLQPRICPKP